MLGWINLSIEAFITDTFGRQTWNEVVALSGVHTNWVSSCPYSDKVTYDLVTTAAGLLGVQVADALEAYGLYFVQHVQDQGYTKLLHVLGSNLAEFLQNLNNLHLHLSMGWPSMVAPGFRCEQVTPESLLLHYYSSRAGLWPIVVGVLKGVARQHWGLDLVVSLVASREAGDSDHEVFLLRYPYQEQLKEWDRAEAAAASLYSMPCDLFYRLHPFHLLLDEQLRVLQAGWAMTRVAPGLLPGDALSQHFKVRHPYVAPQFEAMVQNANSSFLVMARHTGTLLKGQMVPTTLPPAAAAAAWQRCRPPPPQQQQQQQQEEEGGETDDMCSPHAAGRSGTAGGCCPFAALAASGGASGDQQQSRSASVGGVGGGVRVLLFLASPRVSSLAEMQAAGLFLSDIPVHDMSSDFILLAEQRQAEAQLKEKYEKLTVELKAANDKLARTSAWLEEEKARAEALLHRMSGLIACFPDGPGDRKAGGPGRNSLGTSCSETTRESITLDRIEAVRRELTKANVLGGEADTIQCLELLGEGTYGKVYKGLWKGSVVAVKTIVLPANMSGAEKREKMAIMEAAISSALSHPNIMQTYTYDIKPIRDRSRPDNGLMILGASTAGSAAAATSRGPPGVGDSVADLSATQGGEEAASGTVHSYEVRLVLEYCDRGSLRDALDGGGFRLPARPGGGAGAGAAAAAAVPAAPGPVNYCAVLDTAIDIATAMIHLHARNVLHSDLKARNIMLKSNGSEGRGVVAKVADFGLSVKMDHMETHLSNAFQGTMTHMAPEVMMKGHISKAADVYAFGMVLWEVYTAGHVFKGVPRALLGHQITVANKRPQWPPATPPDYAALAAACWDAAAAARPTFEQVLEQLQHLRLQQHAITPPLGAYVAQEVVPAQSSGRLQPRPGGGVVGGSAREGIEEEGEATAGLVGPGERSIYLENSASSMEDTCGRSRRSDGSDG